MLFSEDLLEKKINENIDIEVGKFEEWELKMQTNLYTVLPVL